MRNKLVSIAMATYNGEKFLEDQLNSIYNQTHKNIEIVVCDDNSTDTTIEILEKYKQKNGLRYYVNKKKLGYSKNFERAISLCKGEYIAFSDQDDLWMPEKIETLVNEIGDYSLIHSDAKIIDLSGNIISDSIKINSKLLNYMGNSFDKISFVSFVQGCTILIKREIVNKAIPIPNNEPHDWWFAMVASKIDGVKYIKKPLIFWRKHNSTTCRPFHKNLIIDIYKITFADFYRNFRTLKRALLLKNRGL